MDTRSQIDENRRNAPALFQQLCVEWILNEYKQHSMLDAQDYCEISLLELSKCLFRMSTVHDWLEDAEKRKELIDLLRMDTQRSVVYIEATKILMLAYTD